MLLQLLHRRFNSPSSAVASVTEQCQARKAIISRQSAMQVDASFDQDMAATIRDISDQMALQGVPSARPGQPNHAAPNLLKVLGTADR